MKMIKFICKTGERASVPAANIAAIVDDNGLATITLLHPPLPPIQTDWNYEALVYELERIEADL